MLPLLILLSHCLLIRADEFTEELTISRLPTGNLAARFQFVISDVPKELGPHSYLFPPIMAELAHKYSLSELSLTLGQGNWLPSKWGLPPQPIAPQGATIGAWFDGAKNESEVDHRWHHLVNALNGLFCTSLSEMYPVFTSSIGEKPRGIHWMSENRTLRYGAMAEETVCTENLTPWRKLMPCKKSGLVTLLNPLRLYDSLFHSIGFNLFLECDNTKCANPTWKLTLDAIVVFDVKPTDRSLGFSFELFFGRPMIGKCGIATKSALLYNDDYYTPSFERIPTETRTVGDRTVYVFDLKSTNGNEISRYSVQRSIDTRLTPQSIELDASMLGGESSLSGVLEYSIYSGLGPSPLSASFSLVVPWFAQIQYASLKMRCVAKREEYPSVLSRSFIPSISRKRPASILYEFELRPESKCVVSFKFTRAFMKMSEYPSDANHGKYIPPAVVRVVDPSYQSIYSRDEKSPPSISLFSSPLLLTLPVPDFSMPFNVEAFVCVVISLCFSPILELSCYIMLPVGTVMPLPSKTRKFFRFLLYIITGLCIYAEMNQISPAQLMRYGRAAVNTVINATVQSVTPVSSRFQITAEEKEEL
ncbi:hypothetical protein PFISCL1PPCAC_10242 [Pristionchus fissidentatus]|uniref:GPI transamidase component PIG-T n=1 Tax=Pristionchus fissidentatus TaxID=1538716 RepID=A0AAV5VLV9_9BILA|nr:hypothetical protein PFISCL1PPCAC_10242 [Pristionchus fissidentatus]